MWQPCSCSPAFCGPGCVVRVPAHLPQQRLQREGPGVVPRVPVIALRKVDDAVVRLKCVLENIAQWLQALQSHKCNRLVAPLHVLHNRSIRCQRRRQHRHDLAPADKAKRVQSGLQKLVAQLVVLTNRECRRTRGGQCSGDETPQAAHRQRRSRKTPLASPSRPGAAGSSGACAEGKVMQCTTHTTMARRLTFCTGCMPRTLPKAWHSCATAGTCTRRGAGRNRA